MNFIMKSLFVVVGLYASINWAADNPGSVDSFRHVMNELVDAGLHRAKVFYESW